MSDGLREVWMGGHNYVKCQFLTSWEGSNPPKYVHAYEPAAGLHFVVTQRLGCWAKADVAELVYKLNRQVEEESEIECP